MVRIATLLAVLCLGIVGLSAAYGGPADAQDRTEERLSDLETQVAQLTARVDALEGNGAEREADSGGSSGGARWSGSGVAVSEGFRLTPGRYRASASVETTDHAGFSLVMYGPDDYWELVFNEIIDSAGTWTGEAVVEVETAGDYYLEVSNTTAQWSIVLSRL